jgi:hypothetical protein
MRRITLVQNKSKTQFFSFVLLIIVSCLIGCERNQKLIGKAFYYENRMSCTKIACRCCNDCESNVFLIVKQDTIQLFGNRTYSGNRSRCTIKNGDTTFSADILSTIKENQPLVFSGKECGKLKNPQFEVDKTYEIYGHFIAQNKESVRKLFYVSDQRIVNTQ